MPKTLTVLPMREKDRKLKQELNIVSANAVNASSVATRA
jgi:hypothetical protein